LQITLGQDDVNSIEWLLGVM